MNLRTILLLLLVVIAVVMVYLGYNADMKPPMLTGAGFIVIALILGMKAKS